MYGSNLVCVTEYLFHHSDDELGRTKMDAELHVVHMLEERLELSCSTSLFRPVVYLGRERRHVLAPTTKCCRIRFVHLWYADGLMGGFRRAPIREEDMVVDHF